tara:strand:- start:38 stop:205 length:168 start_codon:yes stop_codon:yes gene_type:complete
MVSRYWESIYSGKWYDKKGDLPTFNLQGIFTFKTNGKYLSLGLDEMNCKMLEIYF